ncbi:MAG TPA: cytochrome c biogenesis protein CcdA [Sedimentisphaerales bacterium]|nr:cytochrome c biogenesis protein CcdA [Sedimentisphaerales bacterium]
MISELQGSAVWPGDMALLPAFIAGTAVSLGLCAVVRLPIVFAYVAGAARSKRHGFSLAMLFVAGLVVGTVLLGMTAASGHEGLRSILWFTRYLLCALGVALFLVGVLVSGLINPHLLSERGQRIAQRMGKADSLGAVLLGCAFGLLQTPACPHCGTAIQALAEMAAAGPGLRGIGLFAAFGAGQSVVILAVGVLTTLTMPNLLRFLRTRMCSVEQRVQLLAGNVLMVLGVYFVIVS